MVRANPKGDDIMSHPVCNIKITVLCLLLMILTACAGSAPTRLYILNSIAGSAGETQPAADVPHVTIGIGPVEFPAYLDRQPIVTRVSANELHLAGFDQWAEPLKDNWTRVLIENLSILLATDSFILLPFRGPEPTDYRVVVEVIRFDGQLGKDVSLLVHWSIFGKNDKKICMTRRSSFKETTGASGYEALVAAQSRTVEALSHEIAGAIKGLSGGK
jgi:uncharacterized lipoprotein YmbA